MKSNKIQALLITHLQKFGSVKLLLPDSMVLEIGINQLDRQGELVNTENYCWVIASREDRMVVLDSYTLGLRYANDTKTFIYEDDFVTSEGESLRRLDVV